MSDVDPTPEPLRRYRADVPSEILHFFDVAPVLAVHDGPWTHSRRPVLGMALIVGGWIAAALVVLAVVLDQVRDDTFLDDGNKIAAGLIVAVCAFMLVAGPGAFLKHGRFRHTPSGRRLREFSEKYRGTEDAAAAIHAALSERGRRPITYRDIITLTRSPDASGDGGDIVVTAYAVARAETAVATVHLRTADDEFVIWPPVTISQDAINGLVQPSQDSTDWNAIGQ